jgi:hypothetical protein
MYDCSEFFFTSPAQKGYEVSTKSYPTCTWLVDDARGSLRNSRQNTEVNICFENVWQSEGKALRIPCLGTRRKYCGMCWQPLLGKHHVTCFLCGLTPACYVTMGRLRFLRGLFRGNNSRCNSGCFLFGPFPGYIARTSAGSPVSSELSLQLTERVSCESQSEEGGSGPWLGGHGQSSWEESSETVSRQSGNCERVCRRSWALNNYDSAERWQLVNTPGLRRLVCVCLTVNCKV